MESYKITKTYIGGSADGYSVLMWSKLDRESAEEIAAYNREIYGEIARIDVIKE